MSNNGTKRALTAVEEIKVQNGDAEERMIAVFRSRDAHVKALG